MAAIHDMTIPLCPNLSYHIFNRGINRKAIFFNEDNYRYFLQKYSNYMRNYWTTYSWVLMENHFHLIVKVNDEESIAKTAKLDFKRFDQLFVRKHAPLIDQVRKKAGLASAADLTGFGNSRTADLTGFKNLLNLSELHSSELYHQLLTWAISERFRRFLLGYAKAINKQQHRTGSLFQKSFRRKLLGSHSYLKTAICYVHHNPIHHGYVVDYDQYTWSSYRERLKWNPNDLYGLSEVFGSVEEFHLCHEAYKYSADPIEF